MTHKILHPEGWLKPRGYSNGISASGRQVYVAGQIAWDGQGALVGASLVPQVRQALLNIVAVLATDGALPEHLVRLTWYITDRDAFHRSGEAVGEVYREVIGRHYPAMSAVQVVALMEPGALVEIEATAVVPLSEGGP